MRTKLARYGKTVTGVLATGLIFSHASVAFQFSRLPGFLEYFGKYPPVETVPTAHEQVLLQRFRPRFFLDENQEPFIDFYEDYIAQGYLADEKGGVIADDVDQPLLNEYKDDTGVVFVHVPESRSTKRVVYARIDYDTLDAHGASADLTFLTYNLVFRHSGLPAGLSRWKKIMLRIVASTRDWHQLDHYVAMTLALTADGAPLAVSLQQHNYQTTYIIGKDIPTPSDGRLALDVALSSNELYPHSATRTEHRAVSFMSVESAHYLITGEKPPRLAGDDVTNGVKEVEYELKFLPPADAFYRFQGKLGETRKLPGRDGPPGADYNTIPALKPKATAMVVFYRRPNDAEYVNLLRAWRGSLDSTLQADVMARYVERFAEDLQSVYGRL
ncbi:MAG: hypothetical protein ACR2RB_18050 [Gammaproteobacteria bacterium]